MSRLSLYRVLEFPFVFSLSQALLAPGSNFFLQKQYKLFLKDLKGLYLMSAVGHHSERQCPMDLFWDAILIINM